jgi:hypothetical protein
MHWLLGLVVRGWRGLVDVVVSAGHWIYMLGGSHRVVNFVDSSGFQTTADE